MAKLPKPDEEPARLGEYLDRGPRGGAVPNPRQVTLEPRDDRLPPTQGVWADAGERIGPARLIKMHPRAAEEWARTMIRRALDVGRCQHDDSSRPEMYDLDIYRNQLPAGRGHRCCRRRFD